MDRKQLKAYVGPSKGMLIIGIIVFAIGIMFVAAVHEAFPIALFFTAIALLLVVPYILSVKRLDKQLDDFDQQGMLSSVLNDFARGWDANLLKGSICMGERWIFGKNSGRIVAYSEIERFYQYVHKTNYIEDSRRIRVKLTDGKTCDIAKLRVRGKDNDTLNEIAVRVKAKNPGIQFGYK